MRVARFVLKIIALCFFAAAVACAVTAYSDRIADLFGSFRDRLEEKKRNIRPTEYDDYADWDE